MSHDENRGNEPVQHNDRQPDGTAPEGTPADLAPQPDDADDDQGDVTLQPEIPKVGSRDAPGG